jgi:hypothetical protein
MKKNAPWRRKLKHAAKLNGENSTVIPNALTQPLRSAGRNHANRRRPNNVISLAQTSETLTPTKNSHERKYR